MIKTAPIVALKREHVRPAEEPGSSAHCEPRTWPRRRTFICFGEDWGRHPSTLQFLAGQLAKDHTVLWINSLGLRRPSFTFSDLHRICSKLWRWWRGPSCTEQSERMLVIFTPIVLPLHRYRWARAFNRLILRRAVRRLLRVYAPGQAPVVITACPSTANLIGHLGERRSVYYCADEYAQLPGMDPALVTELESELLRKVSTVVATSHSLATNKKMSGKPINLLRHGVEVKHFQRAMLPETPVLPALENIPRPIFGYHGLVQDIIDFPLIASAAKQRPEWSFVFVGERIGQPAGFPQAPNIHYLPAVPYELLPSFLKGVDVCLIPYCVDSRTRDRNPVKLREYLAAGKPVLATPLPEVLVYRDVVAFATTVADFLRQGEMLLRQPGLERVRLGIARTQHDDWESVTRRFLQLVDASVSQAIDRP